MIFHDQLIDVVEGFEQSLLTAHDNFIAALHSELRNSSVSEETLQSLDHKQWATVPFMLTKSISGMKKHIEQTQRDMNCIMMLVVQ